MNNLITLHNFILLICNKWRFCNTNSLSTILLSCWHCARNPIAALCARSYHKPRYARASQEPQTRSPGYAHRKPACRHINICPQVPPTAGHRMLPLCAPTATTDGPALHPEPVGLPRGRTPPHHTGDAALPLHSPPLRKSVVSLNILLPATRAAAPAPEAWANTAPEEVADYLCRTCGRFNTAFGRQKGAPYPLSALVYPAAPTPATQLRLPESCASFQHTHLEAPSEATCARMDPADQRAYVRGLEACLREAHRLHTRALSTPQGQERITSPRHPPGQEGQDGPRDPPARPPTGRGSLASTQAQPRCTNPLTILRGTPTATPSPTPTTTAVPWHPSLADQPGTATGTNPHCTRTANHAVPGSVGPAAPSAGPRRPRRLAPDAPALQRPAAASAPQRASAAGPHMPPNPCSTLDRTTPSRVPQTHLPPPPALAIVPTGAMIKTRSQHILTNTTTQQHLPPPLHGPTTFRPPCAPVDPRGAVHAHQQHQGLPCASHSTGSPLNCNSCLRAPPTSSRPAPINHIPTRIAREAPPDPTLRPARGQETCTGRTHTVHITRQDTHTPIQHKTYPHPPRHQQCVPKKFKFQPPTPDQTTETTHGDPHQPPATPSPADAHHREPLLPVPPGESPSPDPTRNQDNPPLH